MIFSRSYAISSAHQIFYRAISSFSGIFGLLALPHIYSKTLGSVVRKPARGQNTRTTTLRYKCTVPRQVFHDTPFFLPFHVTCTSFFLSLCSLLQAEFVSCRTAIIYENSFTVKLFFPAYLNGYFVVQRGAKKILYSHRNLTIVRIYFQLTAF